MVRDTIKGGVKNDPAFLLASALGGAYIFYANHTDFPFGLFSPLQRYKTNRSRLKKVNQGLGQGGGRRKSGAYTVVCEHFEPTRNAAMGP